MADKDNVVQFPRLVSDAPMSAAEVKDRISSYKENYANDLAEIIWENVLHEMARANCDFDSDIDKYFPNMIMILKVLKLYIYSQWVLTIHYNNLRVRMLLLSNQTALTQSVD